MKRFGFLSQAALSLALGAGFLCLDSTWVQAGGSNIGGSDRGSQFVANWCRENIGVLEDARTQATLHLADNDLAQAKEVLEQGLIAAMDTAQVSLPNSLTYQAIARGLEFIALVGDASKMGSYSLEAVVNLFYHYYDFILNLAYPLDLQAPYGRDTEYERRFEEYAAQEIRWFVSAFSTRGLQGGFYPRYSAKLYLSVLELIAKYTAEDLANSLWQAKYSCIIDELNRLNLRLAAFNSGNLASFRNERWAVNLATSEILGIASKMREVRCSGSGWMPPYPRDFDLKTVF